MGPGDMQPASDDIVISQALSAMLNYETNSRHASQHPSARKGSRTFPGLQQKYISTYTPTKTISQACLPTS